MKREFITILDTEHTVLSTRFASVEETLPQLEAKGFTVNILTSHVPIFNTDGAVFETVLEVS